MAVPNRRELQPTTELGAGESKPDYQDNADFTVGTEGLDYAGNVLSNCISVEVQLRDMLEELTEITPVLVYLSSDSDGESAPQAAQTSMTVRVGTELRSISAEAYLECITDVNGILTIDVVDTGTPTRYLVVEYKGRIFVSDAMTWAN